MNRIAFIAFINGIARGVSLGADSRQYILDDNGKYSASPVTKNPFRMDPRVKSLIN